MAKESDIDRFYKDAYISSLVRRGCKEYIAEVKARRIVIKKNEL
jgi:hypothetical protein